MQLDITGHQIDLTDALQKHVRGKMRKLERHSNEITHMHVVLNIEKHCHQAEATARSRGLNCLPMQMPKICTQPSIYWPIKSIGSCSNTKKKHSKTKRQPSQDTAARLTARCLAAELPNQAHPILQ